jgi:predicted RND superfamily exporter protein
VLARGRDRLWQLVDENYARGLVTVYMTNANFRDTGKLMHAIREYEQANLAPADVSLSFAGDVAVSQTLIDAIVQTQVRSLLISLAGIFVVTSLLGRSLRWGLFCALPCGLAVLINFAAMGLVGIPLGVATSMFAGMTLGIGVDYAIHLMERHRQALAEGLTGRVAVVEAVGSTGPAVLIDALAVGLGFGVLTLSQVPANARLGGLLALSIASCLAATLLLLPALLAVWPGLADRPSAVLAKEPPTA